MIIVAGVIGGCINSWRLKIVTPNPLPKKKINKILVLIEMNKYEVIKMKIN